MEKYKNTWLYCPVCADVYIYDESRKTCDRCGAVLVESGIEVKGNASEMINLAKQNPMFNQTLFETFERQENEKWERERQEYLQRKELEELRQRADREAEIQRHLDRNDPRCPICQSFDVRRIGAIDRATSILGLGIFSKKINKTYQCNHCKATF